MSPCVLLALVCLGLALCLLSNNRLGVPLGTSKGKCLLFRGKKAEERGVKGVTGPPAGPEWELGLMIGIDCLLIPLP